MYRYSFYIARQLAHSTVIVTLSLTSIVWLTQALRLIDFIVNQGISIRVFVTLTLLLVPSLIMLILPVALFCAIVFVYHKLKTDSELIVMQAAGLSPWHIARPALIVAAGVMVVGYSISAYFLPVTYSKFKEMQSFLRNNYVSILLQEGVFSSPVPGLTVYVRERHSDGTLEGILVHDARTDGMSMTMLAKSGTLVETPQGPRFLLQQGSRQEMQNGRLSYLSFDSYALDISLYAKNMDGKRKRDPQELGIGQMMRADGLEDGEAMRLRAEAHQRLIWPAYAFTLAALAVAVLLSGEFNRRAGLRRNLMAVAGAVGIIMAAVGLRNIIGNTPQLVPVAYLNALLPAALAMAWLLGKLPMRRKAS